MINQRTVFVLGAGASQPYSFSTGPKLIKALLEAKLDGGEYHGVKLNQEGLLNFQQQLRRASPPSIDLFLEHQKPELQKFGKVLIAGHILSLEHESRLYPGEDHWYQLFLDKFPEPFDKLDFTNVTIITFNYDRSFKQFLHQAISSRFAKESAEVATALSKLRFIHAYGHLGKLDWEPPGGRAYGPNPTGEQVRAAADGIKIISEGREVNEEAKECLEQAERVFIIGMAYHSDNMRILGFPLNDRGGRFICGSVFDMTDAEISDVKDRYKLWHVGESGDRSTSFLRRSAHFVKL
jgi:hypothetical protein